MITADYKQQFSFKTSCFSQEKCRNRTKFHKAMHLQALTITSTNRLKSQFNKTILRHSPTVNIQKEIRSCVSSETQKESQKINPDGGSVHNVHCSLNTHSVHCPATARDGAGRDTIQHIQSHALHFIKHSYLRSSIFKTNHVYTKKPLKL